MKGGGAAWNHQAKRSRPTQPWVPAAASDHSGRHVGFIPEASVSLVIYSVLPNFGNPLRFSLYLLLQKIEWKKPSVSAIS